jgi:hypothetical protein
MLTFINNIRTYLIFGIRGFYLEVQRLEAATSVGVL